MVFDIRPVESSRFFLAQYGSLLASVFPQSQHLANLDYLDWLYKQNPEGVVIGFDAWDGDRLAAHYVCIPVQFELCGSKQRGLLSLNTVTHPHYQGKGLFTKLANATFDAALLAGYTFVYGVANANSTPGFVGKLGFQLVCPLMARVGFGSPFKRVENSSGNLEFSRVWSHPTLTWRASNPCNPVSIVREEMTLRVRAKTNYPLIDIVGTLNIDLERFEIGPTNSLYMNGIPRLYLGIPGPNNRLAARYLSIPNRFRPSPLNLIFRKLGAEPKVLNANSVSLSFLDFDAY